MDLITHVLFAAGGLLIWSLACLLVYRQAAGVPWAAASTVASLWWLVGAAGAASTFVPEAPVLMLLWVAVGVFGGAHLHAAYERKAGTTTAGEPPPHAESEPTGDDGSESAHFI